MKRTSGAVVVRSGEEWAEIVEEWRRSRQSTLEFCRATGLALKTFRWWRWALRGGRQQARGRTRRVRQASGPRGSAMGGPRAPSSAPAFLEVVATAANPLPLGRRRSGVELVIERAHGERRVCVDADFDAATLRRVVQLLEEV